MAEALLLLAVICPPLGLLCLMLEALLPWRWCRRAERCTGPLLALGLLSVVAAAVVFVLELARG